jgi:hypothetical protein
MTPLTREFSERMSFSRHSIDGIPVRRETHVTAPERIERDTFATKSEAHLSVFEFIEGW